MEMKGRTVATLGFSHRGIRYHKGGSECMTSGTKSQILTFLLQSFQILGGSADHPDHPLTWPLKKVKK